MRYFSLFLSVLIWGNLQACSRIFWTNSVNKVSARTMDLYVDDHPAFFLSPRDIEKIGTTEKNPLKWTSKYGSLVITAFQGKAVSEGMNEKGLAVHLLYLHDTEYEKRDERPGLSNALWVQYLLDQYATVKEALASVHSFQIVSAEVEGRSWPLHVCLEDSSGDSCIIEYVKGNMVIHHGPKYTVMTNEPPYSVQIQNLQKYKYFGGDAPLPGDVDSMSRFVRCSAFLKTLPEPKNISESIAHVLGAISTVQVPFGAEDTSGALSTVTWPTRWISACDTSNKIYYFASTSTPYLIWVSLKKLNFTSKQPLKQVSLQNSSLAGDISNYFVNQ